MNAIFLPMFLQGMAGMHRRWYDGGQGWNVSTHTIWGLTGFQWNVPISWAAWIMKGKDLVVLVDLLGGNLALGDLAKNAVRVGCHMHAPSIHAGTTGLPSLSFSQPLTTR